MSSFDENPPVIDVTEQNIQQAVLETSSSTPVLLYIWANDCESCDVLVSVLEKLAHDYCGRFVLAKLNADEMSSLASQLGVQSIPSVKLVVEGGVVAELEGLPTESAVREMLDGFVQPAAEEIDLKVQIGLALKNKDLPEAQALLQKALVENPVDHAYLAFAVDLLIDAGDLDDASSRFDALTEDAKNSIEGVRASARLYLSKVCLDSADFECWLSALERDSKDEDALFKLSAFYALNYRYDEALERAWQLFQLHMGYKSGEPKILLLKIFDVLGKADKRAHAYRRKMFNYLH